MFSVVPIVRRQLLISTQSKREFAQEPAREAAVKTVSTPTLALGLRMVALTGVSQSNSPLYDTMQGRKLFATL